MGTVLSLVSAAIGVFCAVLGLWSLTGAQASRRVVPFSGGLLVGISLFGVLPDLAERYSWAGGPALLAVGVALLWLVGRYVYPVCPSCSHTHQHELCSAALHGFATPLVVAATLHSFLDGLGIAASQQRSADALGTTLVLAVILHKIPEGVALGVMLRAALPTRASALLWCALAESATFLGGLLESIVAPGLRRSMGELLRPGAGRRQLPLPGLPRRAWRVEAPRQVRLRPRPDRRRGSGRPSARSKLSAPVVERSAPP